MRSKSIQGGINLPCSQKTRCENEHSTSKTALFRRISYPHPQSMHIHVFHIGRRGLPA
ncbi:hypothetical protein BIFGAL_03683 [Bifidobacterium gallicum DSM 20093 = LMG 11596]|uniref:Uncharacterized protein n=1 Tax=Bifidobacterium gallicum DSM 20093 = LMG 11596 TaxID=561180 RepID=D1NV05_9BIFI|nr:hypothetical protein BIFGAL_03683 [Bifidobacterium gallicum DSM 20093 = LMG 11596]